MCTREDAGEDFADCATMFTPLPWAPCRAAHEWAGDFRSVRSPKLRLMNCAAADGMQHPLYFSAFVKHGLAATGVAIIQSRVPLQLAYSVLFEQVLGLGNGGGCCSLRE